MQRAASSQFRILKLLEILSAESSADKPLKGSDILRRLEKNGMCITRATLKNDIKLLCGSNFDVQSVRLASGECYYLASKTAEAAETPPKREAEYSAIIGCVAKAVRDETQLALSIVDCIGEYCMSPYAVMYDDSGYYAVGFSSAHRRVISLPISKISGAKQTALPIEAPPADYSSSHYISRGLKLYVSARETVIFSFNEDALQDVKFRFGKTATISKGDSGLYLAETRLTVTPSLFAWVFQLGGRLRIVSPEHVCSEYKNCLRTQLAAYG